MKRPILSVFTVSTLFCCFTLYAQDSIVTIIAKGNVLLMAPDKDSFSGMGVDKTIGESKGK